MGDAGEEEADRGAATAALQRGGAGRGGMRTYRDALGASLQGHSSARGLWDSTMVGAALPENTSAAGGGEGGGARWRGAARERRVPPISIFCCCCCCGAYKYLKPRM